ncbi:MAG: dTDP-4-dehydrorhamnose reductase [Rhodobacteraceae bacterium]|nr:dTDP-4-dehydrorhamnose reductase [Silicimonas sp.]RZW05541.1 MAG: dTDP-4-dehydrorhamnose reductase [Paracoccaceae bacterium]
MKIAVFGRSGQVATELARRAPEGVDVHTIGRDRVDFSQPAQVSDAARHLDADAIINAAAFTAVDEAESQPELALSVNALSVANLAEIAAERHLPLVHISTDYVFDGSGDQPRAPDAAPGPLGVYGQSKLHGEALVVNAGGPHIILRTSWVFSAHGSNFVKTMLRLGAEHDRLSIVADQVGGPTPAAAIADACLSLADALAKGHGGGTYHFSGAPDVSWADFAREIFRQAGTATDVVDIPTTDYPTPARRPLNSRLDCSTLAADFGISRPDWKAGLADVLKELRA